MPLPKPKAGEKQDDFIERCMGSKVIQEDFDDHEQQLAVCFSQWRKPKEKKNMERRYLLYKYTELRADEKENTIYGYGARFNVWSSPLGMFKEKIRKGAFSKTIGESDIRSLFNHDPNFILSRTRNKTLRLWEDEKGLAFEAKLPDTSYAKDLLENIRRKNITQNSFGFEAIQDEWNKAGNKRELVEVKLFDVGPVTFPAYPQTSVQARSVFNDHGIDYDAICRIFLRKDRGMELTNSDRDLLVSTMDILKSYIPDEEPIIEAHSEEHVVSPEEPSAEDHSEVVSGPDYTTLMKSKMKVREVLDYLEGA
jgi:HK97 family phage prohead protease